MPIFGDVVRKTFQEVPQAIDIGVDDRVAPGVREQPHILVVGIGGVVEHAHQFVSSIVKDTIHVFTKIIASKGRIYTRHVETSDIFHQYLQKNIETRIREKHSITLSNSYTLTRYNGFLKQLM